jgi:chromosome segregation ATPase
MGIELEAQREDLENHINELLREIAEVDIRLEECLIDSRSYENRVLFLKKQLAKAQRELDQLD